MTKAEDKQELKELRQEAHQKHVDAKNIDFSIETEKFASMWAVASKSQRALVKMYIRNQNREGVNNWVKCQRTTLAIGDQSYTWLKKRAKELRVPNYSRLLKHQLIEAIESKETAT